MVIDMSKSRQYRWFLVKTRISEKLSDCLVFRRNTLTYRQLAVWRLSGNCLDGLLMRGIFRWEELHALAESWNQEYGCCNTDFLDRRLTAILPNRGKQRAPDVKPTPVGQAPCPIFSPNRSLGFACIIRKNWCRRRSWTLWFSSLLMSH